MADKNMEAQISVEFEEATSRQSLNSGETINTLWSKVKRWLSDLKAVAFSGSYNDLSDKPTTATTEVDGLMSAEDKTKLDNADDTYALKSLYGDTTINVGRKSGTDIGDYSIVIGHGSSATKQGAVAEGDSNTASGIYSHAEGMGTTASAYCSHSEGQSSTADGEYAHAGGRYSSAIGCASFAHGYYVNAYSSSNKNAGHAAFGMYNSANTHTLFSIGDGTADDARHNAFEITTTGGKLHNKDIATTDLIPTTLPANGGNADTVGGMHAAAFLQNTAPINLATSINDMTTAGTYGVYSATPDFPVGYGSWGFLEVRRYGNLCYQTIIFETSIIITRAKNVAQEGWTKWEQISTTPIKSTTLSATTDGTGNFALLSANENKVPISIKLDNKPFYAVPFLYNNQLWMGSTISETTRQPVANVDISGTIYYIEV